MFIAALLVTVTLASQEPPAAQTASPSAEDNAAERTFRNEALAFAYEVPEGWEVILRETKKPSGPNLTPILRAHPRGADKAVRDARFIGIFGFEVEAELRGVLTPETLMEEQYSRRIEDGFTIPIGGLQRMKAGSVEVLLREYRAVDEGRKRYWIDLVAARFGCVLVMALVTDSEEEFQRLQSSLSTLRFAAPLRIRVSQGVADENLVRKVPPKYPPAARAASIQGTVVLRVVISKEGKVQDVKVVSGPPELVASAVEAVKQWEYRPYLLQGEPIEVETQVTVNYRLR